MYTKKITVSSILLTSAFALLFFFTPLDHVAAQSTPDTAHASHADSQAHAARIEERLQEIRPDHDEIQRLRAAEEAATAAREEAEWARESCLLSSSTDCSTEIAAVTRAQATLDSAQEERAEFAAGLQQSDTSEEAVIEQHDILHGAHAQAQREVHASQRAVEEAELSGVAADSLEHLELRMQHLLARRAQAARCLAVAIPANAEVCEAMFPQEDRNELHVITQQVIDMRRDVLSRTQVNVGSLLTVSGRSPFQDITGLVGVLLDALTFLVGTVALIFIVIGGVRMVISAGDDTALQRAKEMVKYAVIGLVVTLLAYLIIVVVQSFLYR